MRPPRDDVVEDEDEDEEDPDADLAAERAEPPGAEAWRALSGVPHCACAFWITLVLSSRNISDSWSLYPGHFLPTRMHWEHSGRTLSH